MKCVNDYSECVSVVCQMCAEALFLHLDLWKTLQLRKKFCLHVVKSLLCLLRRWGELLVKILSAFLRQRSHVERYLILYASVYNSS